jgi:hypothetical protein
MDWVDRLPDLLSEWVGNLAVLLSQCVVLVVAVACAFMVARRPAVHTERPSLVVFAAINVFGFLAAFTMRVGLAIVHAWRLVLHPGAWLIAPLLSLLLITASVAAFVFGGLRGVRPVRLAALGVLVAVWLYVLLSWRVLNVLLGLVNLYRWLDWWSLAQVLAVAVAAIPFTACLAALRTEVRRRFPLPVPAPPASLPTASGPEGRDGRPSV